MGLFTRGSKASTDDQYEYADTKEGLCFVRTLPLAELAYRTARDVQRGATWGELTTAAQIGAVQVYLELAHRIGAPDKDKWLLGSVLDLVKHVIRDAQPNDKPDDPQELRRGQRIANGIAKVWCARAARRDEERYWEAAGRIPQQRAAWTSDRGFAFLRVAGMVPHLLQQAPDLRAVEECCVVERLRWALGDGVFESALADRRLYIVPPSAYELLHHVGTRTDTEHPQRPRFLAPPTAVFVRPADSSYLEPVAIAFDRRTIVYRDAAWPRAKLHFQVADSVYHTFVAHLPQTHFVLEPIIIGTRRTFDVDERDHPILRLLEPHIAGTLAVNYVTLNTALSRDTPFGEFIAANHQSTLDLAAAAFRQRAGDFCTHFDFVELRDDDLEHPFRDDYGKLRVALCDWVKAFVAIHYVDDDAVRNDLVLGCWSEEVRPRIPGFPRIADRDSLVRAVRTIIELASLQHAAIHFPQTDIGRFAIVAPYFAADIPPVGLAPRDARLNVLDSLPDIHAAAWQSFVLGQAEVRWRTLDGLTIRHDARPTEARLEREAADRLRSALDRIEEEIQARNAVLVEDGLWSYEYLRPGKIPCSVNT